MAIYGMMDWIVDMNHYRKIKFNAKFDIILGIHTLSFLEADDGAHPDY